MDFLLDFILHIDQYMIDIVQEYHTWTYVILFLIIFCETGLVVIPFLPGDSLLFVAGAIAALPDTPLDVNMLFLILFVAAVLGDSCNYMIGRFFGRTLFSNPNSRIFRRSHLEKTHEFYKIWRKDYYFCTFCAHSPYVCSVCGRNGEYALLLFHAVQSDRRSTVDCHILLRRIFLRRSSFRTGESETADCRHHSGISIACCGRGGARPAEIP